MVTVADSKMPHVMLRFGPFVVSGSLAAIAFARGNYLLGFGYGMGYAFIAAAIAYAFCRPHANTTSRRCVLALLAIPLGYVLAFPASINPELQYFIDDQKIARSVRSELNAVFASDSRFANLAVSTRQLKCVNVTISGSLNNRNELPPLRGRIYDECQHIQKCILHWQITDRQTGSRIGQLDSTLLGRDATGSET
jgi:hypothetical protein